MTENRIPLEPAPNMKSLLQQRTQAFGSAIFARVDRQGPVLFTKSWFDERLMGVTTANESLKVQLFRFVDTLPAIIDQPEANGRHLREYLDEASADLPWWVRQAIRFIPETGLRGRLLAYAAKTGTQQMARKFIAGSNVEEAIAAVGKLRAQELAFTLDLLGEATITEHEADLVQKEYLELVQGLTDAVNNWPEIPAIDRDDRGPIPRVNVSVKLSALYSQFDPIDPEGTSKAVRERLRPILSLAKKTGAFVNFDMEHYSFKDVTIQIFRDILTEPEFIDWPDVGIAIQAYLTDTEHDLQELIAWAKAKRQAPVWVRLVKGAYWDFETVMAQQHDWPIPVWTQKWQSDACFERCSRLLFENIDYVIPAIASHNIRSIAHAMALAEELGVPSQRFEFQLLYGMADTIKDAIKSLGYRVRVYTPYGKLLPGMAYLVRRLLENTSNDSFLKQGMAANIDEEKLLMNPDQSNGVSTSPPRKLGSSSTSPQRKLGHLPSENPSLRGGLVGTAFRNEPLSDFARAENRDKMVAALKQVRTQLGKRYPLVIGNANVETAKWITSVNSSKIAEVIGECGSANVEQANQAVAAALKAFDDWRDTAVEKRADYLHKVAQRMRERRFELSAWITLETGKPWRESDADVAEAIDFCDYYAIEMLKLSDGQHRDVPGEDNTLIYEPRGVAVVIAPWNFPLAILAGMTTAALVTGNTVVMKPAEQSCVVAAKLMELFQEAGVPKGVVNYLPGIGEEIGPTLVDHPDVALIAFTGSLPVALSINESASKVVEGQQFVKKVIAEMGGKNATIIDSDADLDEAVRGVVDAAFGYAGQKCSAGSRAIVLEEIYDQFVNRLVEAVKSLAVKPADDPGCAVGPVIDADARKRIDHYIEKGKAEARLAYATDVGELANEGYFVGPHVFADVPENASIAQEEIFGPVLAVIRAKDLDDALRIANGTPYALTGGCYSRSPDNIDKIKRKFRVGNLYINRKCTGALVDRQPFGGFKMSGIGSKAGGPDYLLQFLLPRTITENTMRRGFAPEVD